MCRLCKFLQLFALHSSSHVMLAMALERVLFVFRPVMSLDPDQRFVKMMLCAAWCLSAFYSLPQIYVWRTFQLTRNWSQCTTIWQTMRRRCEIPLETRIPSETVYTLAHLITVFWLPAVGITIIYATIFRTVLQRQRRFAQTNLPLVQCPLSSNSGQEEMDETQMHSDVQMSHHIINRIFKRTLLVAVVYVLCWLPYNVQALVRSVVRIDSAWMEYLDLLTILIALDSVINPLLYNVT